MNCGAKPSVTFAGSSPRASANVAMLRMPPRRGAPPAAGAGAESSFEQPASATPSTIVSSLPRIERIAQSFTEKIEAEHGDHDCDAGRADDPRCRREVILALEQHVPP